MTIGEKIKYLRNEKGWSQDKLGEISNIHGRQLSKYETNRVLPSISIVKKLSEIFNVSTDFLICDNYPKLNKENLTNLDLIDLIGHLKEFNDKDKNTIKEVVRAIDLRRKQNE